MVSTTSRESSDALERAVQVKHHFQDGRYALAAFRLGNDDYVFLHDADQRSLSLGQQTQAIDLPAFWQKHQENATYCIVCELMLCFKSGGSPFLVNRRWNWASARARR
jgi:signal transduction histidine kinase